MRLLMMGICSENCVIKRFRCWANVYLHKPRQYSLLLLGYKPVQHVTALNTIGQCFSNIFQVGTTFTSQNVLRTTPLLFPLKANCLRFSTIVCDMQFTIILFFLSFLD
jgi:hypothetical protein